MARRSVGEGSVTLRSDGRWQAALQVAGRRITAYGRTRQEAVSRLRDLQQAAQRTGALPTAGTTTVASYLTTWLAGGEHRLRPKTYDVYHRTAQVHILPHLGHARLARISPLAVLRWQAALRKAGVGPSAIAKAHRVLHTALADAVRWGLIPSNPCASVPVPKETPKERALWSPQQVQAVLAHLQQSDGHYANLFGFLLATGCRIGEALGLQWQDVDWEHDAVTIRRQVTEVRGEPVTGAPKTKAGIRTVPLPAWGMAFLHRQRAQAARQRLEKGLGAPLPEDAVFTTSALTTPLQGNVRRALQATCRAAGVPVLTTHALRHVHLSLLAMAGVPVKVAQERAGHATASVTMAVYTHVLGDAHRQAAGALEGLAPAGVAVGG